MCFKSWVARILLVKAQEKSVIESILNAGMAQSYFFRAD
jgi:hypothetical protein